MQGRVAFLPSAPVSLKYLKPKEPEIKPKTLGDHIRRVRLQRSLTQPEAARLLGVVPSALLNWEKGRKEPSIRAIPVVLGFLGYDPFPEPRTLPERLLAKRRSMGWTIREAARHAGVDPTTWGDWERGKVILYRRHRTTIARLIGRPTDILNQQMTARWNEAHEGRRE
jgi:transcriptional regulator with XRE-family HTH domain